MAKVKKVGTDGVESEDQLDTMLDSKEFKGTHYGTVTEETMPKIDIISTGSVNFNSILDGGFRSASWARFQAEPECGKTSMGLCWGAQWQKFYKEDEQGMVIVFDAEGRISGNPSILGRCGINTGKNVFRLIRMNRSDKIFSIMEKLITDNPNDRKYFFIVDSTDACVRDCDNDKEIGDAAKIGGTATILSAAGKKLSLPFSSTGHFLYLTSQMRDAMSTNGKGGPVKKKASGGWAPKFYSSLIGTIKPPWTETYIYANPSDTKSEKIGQITEIFLEKTPNQKTGKTVQIPIKWGLQGGVWRAYEAMMLADLWEFTKKNGAHYSVSESFAQELSEAKIEFTSKFHGEKNLREHFDSNTDLTEFVINKVSELKGFKL